MENNKQILPYIMHYLQKEDTEQITIVDDSFVVQLSEHNAHGFWKRGARLVGIILTCITVVLFLIYSVVFYCQNVLFYRGELNINQFGAFTPSKSYSSEYAMYLFDTNEKWISSGIQVQEGDRLFISASGAFHSNYKELVNAAKNNTLADSVKKDSAQTRLRWTFYPRIQSAGAYVIHEKDTANAAYKNVVNSTANSPVCFGDVLFQVVPEYQISNVHFADTTRIYKVPYASPYTPHLHRSRREPVKVGQNGVLAFMVNDRKTSNNIGQILVVMEIFRKSDGYCGGILTLKRMMYRWLDIPYYYYELLLRRGLPVCAVSLYGLLAILTLAFFCIVAYYSPLIIYYIIYLIIKWLKCLKSWSIKGWLTLRNRILKHQSL